MKLNKKFTLLIFSVLAFFPSVTMFAQTQPLTISVGGGYQYYTSKDLRAMTSSYNSTYSSTLNDKMSSTGIPFYYEVNFKYKWLQSVGMSLNYSFSRSHYSAEFENGNSRHFYVRTRTPVDFGVFFGNPDKTEWEIRLGYMTSTVVSEYMYKDGTRNQSTNQALNGTFESFGFFYKVDMTRRIKGPLAIKIGIGGGTSMGEHFNDLSHAREADGMSGEWLPVDFAAYEKVLANGSFYDYPDNKYWKASYFQFYAGLQLRIYKGK